MNEVLHADYSDLVIQIIDKSCVLVDKNNTTDLEKGLNIYTYNSIWKQVKLIGNNYTSPEELGEILGIARVTCRKYLEYMNKEGKIDMIIEYGKVGRPQHKYKINNII